MSNIRCCLGEGMVFVDGINGTRFAGEIHQLADLPWSQLVRCSLSQVRHAIVVSIGSL